MTCPLTPPRELSLLPAFCGLFLPRITGHSYLTYGPLMNRATSIVFEGVPTHPTPARCWEGEFRSRRDFTS